MSLRTIALGMTSAAALSATASADLAGFVAFTREVGGNTVIDVFVGVTSASDRFLNVFATRSDGVFVQKAGMSTKTWKPDSANFTATRQVSDDSFMTAGTFGGGAYGGEYFASPNTAADPNFTGTSWNPTPASAPATTIPFVDNGNAENDGAGWFTADPTSVDNAAEPLSGIPGTRSNSIKVSGDGTATSVSATHGFWVAHLVLAGTGRTLGDGGTATWAAGVSVKPGTGSGAVQGRYKFVASSAPAAPASVNASDGTSTAGVAVSWPAVSGATSYKILRATGAIVPSQVIATATATTYSDSGATAGTTYTYAVKASNSSGDSPLSPTDQGWRNVAAPTGVSATDGTSAANVTVTWNAVAGATGYKVFRAQGSGTPSLLGSTASGVLTFADTDAVPAVVYAYTVKATTAAGDSAASAPDNGSRSGSAPSGVSASDGSSTSVVNVSWNAFTGATGYKVFRAQGSASPSEIGTTASSVRTFADGSATAGVVYMYSVKATTASGDSAASASDAGWRNVPPPVISASEGTSSAHVTISWATRSGVTGYKVFRAVGSATPGQVAEVPGTASTFNDTSATPGVIYNYYARAMTAGGDSALSAADQGWRNVAAPTGIGATDGTNVSAVVVTWNIVTGATGYKVFRTQGGGAPAQLGSTSSSNLSFTDPTASPGIVYGYSVKATAATGDGPFSASDNGFRGVAAPASVAASDGTSTASVSVAWSAVTGATGYKVFRAQAGGPAASVGSTAAGTLNFTDGTAAAGIPYAYTVKATSPGGDGAASAADNGWRNVPAPTGVSATDGTSVANVTVTWNAVAGATGYKVFRAQGTGAAVPLGTVAAGVTSYTDSTGGPGVVYAYSVRATTAAGDSLASSSDNGSRALSGVTGVAATDGSSTVNVTISWNAFSGATGYKVFRAQGSATPSQIGTTVSSVRTFIDSSAVAGTSYSYTVRASTAGGDSASSAPDAGWRNVVAPTGVSATDGASTANVTITWGAVTGATGYKVFRAQGSAAATQVGTTSATVRTFVDANAAAGTTFAYTVRATTTPGDSAASAADNGWRNVPAPTGISAGDGASSTGITVTWGAVAGATGYKVFRSQGSASPTQVGTTTASVRTFTDPSAAVATVYAYTVKATIAPGDTAASSADTGWRNIPAPTGVAATDGTSTGFVSIAWNAVAGATGYRVYRSQGTTTPTLIGSTAVGNLAFTDPDTAVGILHTYTVRATCSLGDGPASAPDTGWRGVSPPFGVAASDGTFAAHVRVTWVASGNTAVTGYVVYRKLSGAAADTVVGQVSGRTTVSFNDTSIAVGQIGNYRVAAKTAAGVAPPSAYDPGFRQNTGSMPSGGGEGSSAGGGGEIATLTAPAAGDGTADEDAPSSGKASSGTTASGSPAFTAALAAAGMDAAAAGSSAPVPDISCETVSARVQALRASAVDESELASLDRLLSPAPDQGAGADRECVACRILAGDVSLDGSVSMEDAFTWLDAWLDGDWTAADLDRDGLMDDRDLRVLLGRLPSASPEPGAR